jgi:hypothetical protein
MKRSFILLLLLGSVNAALAQNSKSASVITRYYYFTGTIDKYPVTFNLYRYNQKFSGSYYYNSTEEVIELYGELDKNGFLKIAASDWEDNQTEVFSGNFKDSAYSGTWSHKGKILPFRISKKTDNSGLTFDYIATSGSKKLPKGEEFDRTELTYDAKSIWPAATSKHSSIDLVKEIIYKAFEAGSSKEPIGKVMISEKNQILNQGKGEDGIAYALERAVRVSYRSAQWLTLSAFTYADNGGVHGNHGTSYTNIDLVNNKVLGVTDVLDTVACRSRLLTLLEKKLRTAYDIKKEVKISDAMLVDTIPITNNISLTSKGIAFNYNPYEIGAYAMGEIRLYIPFKELTGCLKPEFKELIGIVSQ